MRKGLVYEYVGGLIMYKIIEEVFVKFIIINLRGYVINCVKKGY